MRASTAFQQVDKKIVERRQKLNEDAQKEQVALRDLEQALANERSQAFARADPQPREGIAGPHDQARRVFRERNRSSRRRAST